MKLNNNKNPRKISRSLFMLYAVMVCGIVLPCPPFPQMTRWSWSKISPHSSFR